ncbi:MAG: DUF1440 domain-containing protein [Anaerolineae bacterium]|nr:DUF1440 domain-containing protein [Anaerolineae bacterium]
MFKTNAATSRRIPRSIVAGVISTTAMTVVMQQLFSRLPPDEQYPLPPEEIATIAEVKVLGRTLNSEQHMAWTVFSHFGYGMTLAGIYSWIAERLPFTPIVSGVLYGLLVWAGSYMGWLPAFHVLRPATEFPPARRRLMIIAHIVWGAVLGISNSAGLQKDS